MQSRRNLIVIGVILLVGIGSAIFMRMHSRDTSNTTVNNEQNNQATDKTAEDKSSATDKTERKVDKELMNAPIDIQNKFVTLSVAGFGDIKVELYDKDAPKTVENFLRLTRSGYYDGVTFHRVSKGFVIQGGDPTGTGAGGESAFGSDFADELNPNTPSGKEGYKKGVLAMANRGPNTNSSQFFIMLDDAPQLPFAYTIFGKVVAGQDVVDKIGQVQITPGMAPTDGAPVTPVVITKATISDK